MRLAKIVFSNSIHNFFLTLVDAGWQEINCCEKDIYLFITYPWAVLGRGPWLYITQHFKCLWLKVSPKCKLRLCGFALVLVCASHVLLFYLSHKAKHHFFLNNINPTVFENPRRSFTNSYRCSEGVSRFLKDSSVNL